MSLFFLLGHSKEGGSVCSIALLIFEVNEDLAKLPLIQIILGKK